MKRSLATIALVLAWCGLAGANGLLIPVEKTLPPLAMLNHKVTVSLEDQVAITKVEQTFRNHTSRDLEATYIFPVPKGAGVNDFAMWANGKRVKGELMKAEQARKIYTDIVRQTQDPGLLEYMGTDLLRLQIFPVPARGDQKVEVTFTSVSKKDNDIVEYTYPLKTDGKHTATLEEFSLKLNLKSQQPVVSIYSPTHALTINRKSDREAEVAFEKQQAVLDKDFQLFYTLGSKDVGLTALHHRPITGDDGHFMMLISPRYELSKDQVIPRDMIFVLDTSGSMLEDDKIDQAKKALKHCLDGLSEHDRFGVINFSTNVNRYSEKLLPVNKDQISAAKKWVDKLDATGGTNINDALLSALDLKEKDANDGRTFTVVFFTDGKPTIGIMEPDKILGNVTKKNTANTRIFTFGVGNDVNATLLDQVADQTRAVSTYVRPKEDMEVKVSSFFAKINRPVLANLKLTAGEGIRFVEVYPPVLPDLFRGDQLVVLGRYQGDGHAAVTLKGSVGKETKEFVYELNFPTKVEGKEFVEDLWARRKVGYLLEQIRANGDKPELVDEVIKLAKKYGIATPYTSWLIVPDAPMPVAGRPGGSTTVPTASPNPGDPNAQPMPHALVPPGPDGTKPLTAEEFARLRLKEAGASKGDGKGEGFGRIRDDLDRRESERLLKALDQIKDGEGKELYRIITESEEKRRALIGTGDALKSGERKTIDTGKTGVDLAVTVRELKDEQRLRMSAVSRFNGRECLEVGGIWIDQEFGEKTPAVTVKYLSDAYFKILEKHPQMKEVYKLGRYLIWITPSGTALIVDAKNGKDTLGDDEIKTLFTAKAKEEKKEEKKEDKK